MLGVRLPSTVPVVDEYGNVRHLPLETWRSPYLPEAMQRAWTDPDALARLVECALEVGMHADVLAAAEHLSRIDPDRDRRYGLPAITLARNGQFSRAEELLDRHESLYGETWYSLHARAEISLSGNRGARGQKLRRRALELDPDASPPLRRLIEDALHDGREAVEEALRPIASIAGSWRAKLWLARNQVEDAREVTALVRAAVEQSRDERDVLTVASSVLAHRGLTRVLVDFVAPRYQLGRDRLACGINLLFAFLSAGRKVRGEALLHRLEPLLEEAGLGDHADFYSTGFRNLRDPAVDDSVQTPNMDLLKAMAAAVRRNSDKARRKCWSLLATAHVLVPVTRAWIDVPVLVSSWPTTQQLLEIVTGIDSDGREVAIAFTDERTLRAWGPMRAPCVAIEVRSLIAMVAREMRCSVLVNPAGPTATELPLSDIETFLAGDVPPGTESRIRFLASPLRRPVPKGFIEFASDFLSERGIVRQAWLFEIVDDRSGVNPAIAIELNPDTSGADARDLLLDGADEVRWDSRRSRRVRFITLDEGALADYIRSAGLPIRID